MAPLQTRSSRRVWMLRAIALPLAAQLPAAFAARNDAVRTALKYQDTPNAGNQCSACAQFVAGATPQAQGGCRVITQDTEISPTGWCVAFARRSA